MHHGFEGLANSLRKACTSGRVEVNKHIVERRANSAWIWLKGIFLLLMAKLWEDVEQRRDFFDGEII
jgi:hypothetical protein